jgi:hypothetical protein
MSNFDQETSGVDANRGKGNVHPAPAGLENRRSRRLLIIWLLAIGMGLAAVILALEVFVARRIPELTLEQLESARALWDRHGPASYDLDLEKLGERPGPVHVEVRNGQVSIVTVDGREPPPWTRETWTVPGQFIMLEQELLLAEDPIHQMQAQAGTKLRLRCEFDAQYGFPREYQRTVYGGGPDVYWRVTSFAAR